MSREVEAAALAQQAGRAYIPGGSSGGLVGGGAGFGSMGYTASIPANSSFAEVADDDDFDLVPEVDLVDINMRDIDEGRIRSQERGTSGSGGEDDFELGDGTGAVEYGLAGDSSAVGPFLPSAAAVAEPQAVPAVEAEVKTAPAEAPGDGKSARGPREMRRRFPRWHTPSRPPATFCSMRPWRNRRKPKDESGSVVAGIGAPP